MNCEGWKTIGVSFHHNRCIFCLADVLKHGLMAFIPANVYLEALGCLGTRMTKWRLSSEKTLFNVFSEKTIKAKLEL